MINNEEQVPIYQAVAVAIKPPDLSFIKRYAFYNKKCLWHRLQYTLSKENEHWLFYKHGKNPSTYKFDSCELKDLFNICQKLGMKENKYKVVLADLNNKKVCKVKFGTLIECIEWCYNTEIDLENVQSLSSYN